MILNCASWYSDETKEKEKTKLENVNFAQKSGQYVETV